MNVQRMLDGAMPGLPQMRFGVVDVRDVADLHLSAMTDPARQGRTLPGRRRRLHDPRRDRRDPEGRLGDKARARTTRELPDWLVRLASLADSSVQQIVPELGKTKNATGDKAKRLLGWSPRSREDAIVATAESLIKLVGLVEADAPFGDLGPAVRTANAAAARRAGDGGRKHEGGPRRCGDPGRPRRS